jgi:hypothetical protein
MKFRHIPKELNNLSVRYIDSQQGKFPRMCEQEDPGIKGGLGGFGQTNTYTRSLLDA